MFIKKILHLLAICIHLTCILNILRIHQSLLSKPCLQYDLELDTSFKGLYLSWYVMADFNWNTLWGPC